MRNTKGQPSTFGHFSGSAASPIPPLEEAAKVLARLTDPKAEVATLIEMAADGNLGTYTSPAYGQFHKATAASCLVEKMHNGLPVAFGLALCENIIKVPFAIMAYVNNDLNPLKGTAPIGVGLIVIGFFLEEALNSYDKISNPLISATEFRKLIWENHPIKTEAERFIGKPLPDDANAANKILSEYVTPQNQEYPGFGL